MVSIRYDPDFRSHVCGVSIRGERNSVAFVEFRGYDSDSAGGRIEAIDLIG